MAGRKTKIFLWTGGSLLLLFILIVVGGALFLRHAVPKDVIADVRAGIAARNEKDPDARLRKYLSERYGSLDDPRHREKAFTDFFDTDHIKGMQFLVKHSPPGQQKANVAAMANWIASYRADMTPQEKADLGDYFASPAGHAAIQAATGQYMSQDVEYRSSTAQVIVQLMTTLNSVQK